MRAWFPRVRAWTIPPIVLAALTACDRTPTEPTPPPSTCLYSVAPALLTPCMQAPADLTLTVYAVPGCRWAVSTPAEWIILIGDVSGTGLGTARFRVTDNWDAPRESQVVVSGMLAGQTAAARVAQAGCVYWVSQEQFDFSAAAGAGAFDVLQQSIPNACGGPLQNACVWSATADVPWITVTTSMPRTGDSPVAFTVAPNEGAARAGNITVRDKVVRVLQAAR